MRWDAQTTARKIILNGWGNTQAWCTGGKLSSFFKNNFINRRPSDAEQTESRPSVQDLNSLFNVAKPWFFHAPREVLVTTRRSKPTITSGKCVMDRLYRVCLLHWTTLSTIWPGSVDQSVTHGQKSSVCVYSSIPLLHVAVSVNVNMMCLYYYLLLLLLFKECTVQPCFQIVKRKIANRPIRYSKFTRSLVLPE